MTETAHVVASVAPSVAPVAHVVHAAVAPHAQTIQDTLNALAGKVSVADLIVAAGVVSSGVQYLINHFKGLQKTAQWVVSFAIPFILLAGASFASGNNVLGLAPWVYLLGQFVYFVIEAIKSSVTVTSSSQAPAQEF